MVFKGAAHVSSESISVLWWDTCWPTLCGMIYDGDGLVGVTGSMEQMLILLEVPPEILVF